MFGNTKFLDYELTLDNIYRYISQYEIYRYYCGEFEVNKRISSPIRKDRNPSFAIQLYGGTWFWKDFATGESGNAVSLVMKKFSVDFFGALNRLNVDFNLGLNSTSFKTLDKVPYVPETKDKIKAELLIKSRPFTKDDLKFWNSYHITESTLIKYKVKSISHYWINGFCYNVGKYLAYAYEFPDGYKLYFPEKTDYKWFTNSTWIQGLSQLNKENNVLIITKSLKDVMVCDELGLSAIAPQAESIIIKSVDIEKANQIFDKIFTLFDYDNAGIHLAWQMRKLYKIQPLFLTEGLWKRKLGYKGCKDLADYIQKFGLEQTKKLINENLI
jgi:flagellin-specific chaperone FliS